MSCLDENAALALARGELTGPGSDAAHEHVASCPACFAMWVEALHTVGAAPARAEATALPPGTAVNRYTLAQAVGMGSWGTVYEAYDPQLERPVAIKLLHADESTARARESLLVEARAMAKLAHPNIVAVHDVGIWEGQLYLVMELVRGQTLSAWLAARARPWREIVRVFIAAARGLEAAHAAGLVHRDFKPQNVLIGADERVRVTDFGLAQLGGAGQHPGLMAGTPLYMAPEQLRGRPTDARSDQFSLCVALWEALYRQHPFAEDNPRAFSSRLLAGTLRTPAPGDVPRPLFDVLARGLQLSPEKRHPSISALIARLEGALVAGEGRQRRALAVAGAGMLVIASALAFRWDRAATPVCGDGVVAPGEPCDDGNRSDSDACLSTCRWAACGDGRRRAGVEECDDGNQRDGDGCSSSCLVCVPPADGGMAFSWKENGHCYVFHDKPRSWEQAQSVCRRDGSELANFWGPERGAVFAGLLSRRQGAVWLGFREEDGQFRSPVGEHRLYAPRLPGEWRPFPGACAFYRPVWPLLRHDRAKPPVPPDSPIGVGTASCGQPLPFVCEKTPWEIRRTDHHAYHRFFEPLCWADALTYCRVRGGHLVTIDDEAEHNFVSTAPTHMDLWIGAEEEGGISQFRWVTGKPVRFHAFNPGEPDDPAATSCLVLGADRRWHDRDCNAQNGFICEID